MFAKVGARGHGQQLALYTTTHEQAQSIRACNICCFGLSLGFFFPVFYPAEKIRILYIMQLLYAFIMHMYLRFPCMQTGNQSTHFPSYSYLEKPFIRLQYDTAVSLGFRKHKTVLICFALISSKGRNLQIKEYLKRLKIFQLYIMYKKNPGDR